MMKLISPGKIQEYPVIRVVLVECSLIGSRQQQRFHDSPVHTYFRNILVGTIIRVVVGIANIPVSDGCIYLAL